MSPARSSTLRWREIAGRLIGNGSASSFTVASPSARRVRIARRVGSARAANVSVSWSTAIPGVPRGVLRAGLFHPTGLSTTALTMIPGRQDGAGMQTSMEDRVGRIVVTEFVSLDGVMEDPGGSESFEHGGWTFEIDRGEGMTFKLEETMATDALLLGRVTYEGFAEAWPSRDGEFADKFNSMPKHVVSSTLERPEWNNSSVLE